MCRLIEGTLQTGMDGVDGKVLAVALERAWGHLMLPDCACETCADMDLDRGTNHVLRVPDTSQWLLQSAMRCLAWEDPEAYFQFSNESHTCRQHDPQLHFVKATGRRVSLRDFEIEEAYAIDRNTTDGGPDLRHPLAPAILL